MNRKIYKYNDGKKDIFADPTELDHRIAMYRVEESFFPARIAEIPFDEDGNIDQTRATPGDIQLMLDSAYEAEPLIRKAFRIDPFDPSTGEGMFFKDVIDLFNDYMTWKNALKKNIENAPTSATPTG